MTRDAGPAVRLPGGVAGGIGLWSRGGLCGVRLLRWVCGLPVRGFCDLFCVLLFLSQAIRIFVRGFLETMCAF